MMEILIRIGIALVLCIPVALFEMYFMDSHGYFTLCVFISSVVVSMILSVLSRRRA